MVRVAISRTGDDILATVHRVLADIGETVVVPGDFVIVKPNLVRAEPPSSGEITNPLVVEAVLRYCLDAGAGRVIIGEGPGYFNRWERIRDCFTRTGIDEVARRLGVDWVFFDDHGYRTYRDFSRYTPKEFRVSELIFECDKLINLPALKTHYNTRVTLAMKNLKGCLKWEDKPRFHDIDLNRAVVELNKIIRPSVNIIDATVNRRQKEGLLIAGTDPVAVDVIGCALMGIDPAEVPTVTLGAAAGLGEGDITRIDVLGEDLKQLKYKVPLPQELLRQSFPGLEIIGAEQACSGCLIPLLSSLLQIAEEGHKLEPLRIGVGKNPVVTHDRAVVLVGDCAEPFENGTHDYVGGCAPEKEKVLKVLRKYISGG